MMNTQSHFHGLLRAHPDNGRYFADDSGKAIYLTGSHTWANLQDIGLPGDPPFPLIYVPRALAWPIPVRNTSFICRMAAQ
jgi:hypothetical protein